MTSALNAGVHLVAGTTIFIPSGPSGDHLFVVIIEARLIDNVQKILLAPIESVVPKSDTSCLLVVGDHPFISHQSHIGYNHCRVEDVSHVVSCLQSGYFRFGNTPVTPAVLARILQGYSSSDRVPRYIKREWVL